MNIFEFNKIFKFFESKKKEILLFCPAIYLFGIGPLLIKIYFSTLIFKPAGAIWPLNKLLVLTVCFLNFIDNLICSFIGFNLIPLLINNASEFGPKRSNWINLELSDQIKYFIIRRTKLNKINNVWDKKIKWSLKKFILLQISDI